MKFTSSLKRLVFGATLGFFMMFASGCGGGGDGNNLAPSSLRTRSLTLQDPDIADVRTTYMFTATTYTSSGADSGSYTYTRSPTKNNATLQLVSSFTDPVTHQLTFTSRAGGTYLDTSTAKTSTFTMP